MDVSLYNELRYPNGLHIVDKRRGKRVLYPNGVNVVDVDTYIDNVLICNPDINSLKISDEEEAGLVFYYTGSNILFDERDNPLLIPNHEHTLNDINTLIDMCVIDNCRYNDSMFDRVSEEIDFFDRSLNVLFILRVKEIVDAMINQGVAVGVGRGSSCASVVLYLLGITDINPIKYDIPFSELSKEENRL